MTRRYRRLFDLHLGGRARIEAEMDEEVEAHVAMRAADLVRLGMPADQALAEAKRRFGNFDDARRRLRAAARQREAAMQHRDWLGALKSDVRYAARRARNASGFTAVVIAVLAIGIASTTSMFTLVNGVLLRPLPFASPQQLVIIGGRDSARNDVTVASSADWLDWRQARSIAASAVYSYPFRITVLLSDSATRVSAEQVSADFFQTLRAPLAVGRSFSESDVAEEKPVVVVSERLWRSVFAGDARLASPLRTPQGSFSVIGVVASGHEFPAGTDVWSPVRISRTYDPARFDLNWHVLARRRADATNEQVRAEVGTIARAVHATGDPTAIYDYGATVVPLAQFLLGGIDMYLALLMAVVAVVLLIVCANVAASALARATTRAREMAIRASLGAGRARLVMQVLVEHLWLGLIGGAIGLAGGWVITRLVLARWGAEIPRGSEIAIDWRVFLFSVAVSIVAGVASGCLPALVMRKASPRDVLAAGGIHSVGAGRNVTGAVLVAAEIALAMLLLSGAGLLIRSFRSLVGRDIGFSTNIATAEITLAGRRYTDTTRRYAYWDALVQSYRSIPGVQAVGLSQWTPLSITGSGFIDLYDRPGLPASAAYRTVNEDFFKALATPLLSGRTFGSEDAHSAQRVVVINRTLAERFFNGVNPIGRLIRARNMESRPNGPPAAWLLIVGVVGDIRTDGLDQDPRPEMYVDFRQTPAWTFGMTALVRSSSKASSLVPELRRRATAIDPTVAADAGTLDERLRQILGPRTLAMSLLTAFAGLALLLAALGIYGVLSYSVARRTRELALRSALGARREQLIGLIAASGLRVVLPGALIGIGASLALTRVLGSMLVDVRPLDAATFVTAFMVLLVASLFAMMLPAWRATRLDPMTALRSDD